MVTGFAFLSRLTQIAQPHTRFVFLGAGLRLGLPSHPASRRRSCLRLGVSTTSSSRGLSPPIDRPCRAYSRVAGGHFRRKREAPLILRGSTSQFRGHPRTWSRPALLHLSPGCPDLLIRRSGHTVQDRPPPVVRWADVPHLLARVVPCLAAWQEYRQQSLGLGRCGSLTILAARGWVAPISSSWMPVLARSSLDGAARG